MNRRTEPKTEIALTRLLHGELPEDQARALRDRIAREPELAEAWRRLEGSWRDLSLPPASPVPPGFARRVLAGARQETGAAAAGLSWAQAPGWVRAAAATVLVIGAAVGVGVGGRLPAPELAPEIPAASAPAVSPPALSTPPVSAPAAPAVTETPRSEVSPSELDASPVELDDSLAESYWDAMDEIAAGDAADADPENGWEGQP